MDHKRDSDPSKNKCNQPECQKSKCWLVQQTLMPTNNDVKNQQDIPVLDAKHGRTTL